MHSIRLCVFGAINPIIWKTFVNEYYELYSYVWMQKPVKFEVTITWGLTALIKWSNQVKLVSSNDSDYILCTPKSLLLRWKPFRWMSISYGW